MKIASRLLFYISINYQRPIQHIRAYACVFECFIVQEARIPQRLRASAVIYSVQGHSRSLILVPIESPYATAY